MVRHGESVANREGRFTRDGDEPLTALGEEQARERGRAIARVFEPSALYTSPFHRALRSAEEIGRALGLVPRVVDDLHEQSFGVFRGRPYADFYEAHPAASGVGRWGVCPEGGEALRNVARRAGRALDGIARAHPGEEVVVVSHGGVMAALRGYVRRDYSEPSVGTGNANGYVLTFNDEGYSEAVGLDLEESLIQLRASS